MKLYPIIIALTLAIFANAQSFNGITSWGQRSPQDHLLDHQIISKKARYFRKEQGEYTFQVPPTFRRITYIELQDQKQKGHSRALICGGGANFNMVKLCFESDRSHGYNYVLNIYGD